MKIIIISIFILLTSIPIFSEETSNETTSGVSVGMSLKPSLFKNSFVMLTGAKLGLTINHDFYAGLAVYGITFQQYKPDVVDNVDTTTLYPNLDLSYCGLELEYYLNPKNFLNPSILLFSGIGFSSFNIPNLVVNSGNYSPEYKQSNICYIIEPTVNLNLNIKSFYLITCGISYRYFFGLNKIYQTLIRKDKTPFTLDNSEINGFSINFCLRFGSF